MNLNASSLLLTCLSLHHHHHFLLPSQECVSQRIVTSMFLHVRLSADGLQMAPVHSGMWS